MSSVVILYLRRELLLLTTYPPFARLRALSGWRSRPRGELAEHFGRDKQPRGGGGQGLASLPGLEPVLLLALVCNVPPLENERVSQLNERLASPSSSANEQLRQPL